MSSAMHCGRTPLSMPTGIPAGEHGTASQSAAYCAALRARL